VRLTRTSRQRFIRKWRDYEQAYQKGWMSEADLQERVTALVAYVKRTDSLGLRRSLLEEFKAVAISRHEPRESRGQLEQQCDKLSGSESQQQRPDQREQQCRVPVVPHSSIQIPNSRSEQKVEGLTQLLSCPK